MQYYIQIKTDIKNIQPIMMHRINWELSSSKSIFNFKWKYNHKKVNYKLFVLPNENQKIELNKKQIYLMLQM